MSYRFARPRQPQHQRYRSFADVRTLARRVAVGLLLVASSVVLHAQLTVLPAELPHRPDPVIAGRAKVRLTPDAAQNADAVLGMLGLRIERAVLPREQSLRWSTSTQRQPRPSSLNDALDVEERLLRSYVVAWDDVRITPERMVQLLETGCGPIECAAPWCVAQLMGEPNDPQRDRQPMLNLIKVFEAWDVEDGSDTVVIGISDSGLMQPHEDLTDALAVRRGEIPDNGVDDDNNGYVDDYRGYNFCAELGMGTPGNTWHPSDSHGSGVGGIVGATVNNALGIAGIANQCRMFPLRTMPDNIRGIVYGYESLLYCAVNDVDIVNCSWGSQSRSCIDADVIAYTIARGTAVVAAAGNHASPTPFFPASYRGVLSVGVVNSRDDVIAMSGHGPTVDVMAPGHDTWTTGNDGGYMGFCCTSGSAPIAAAIVGLVRSKHPELSPLEACAIVRESVDPAPWTYVPPTIDSLLLPRGRVNALLAVTAEPTSIVSVVYDTVHLAAAGGAQRWGVGDTLNVTPWVINVMGQWQLNRMRVVAVGGVSADAVQVLTPEVSVGLQLTPQQRLSLPQVRLRVTRATDDVAYVVLELNGQRSGGEEVVRRIIVPVTPAPAFVTLANNDVRVSIGDHGRIGNTDLERGQGEGFSFRQWCGQLYEGALMITANGRVVDGARAMRGHNDHFSATKPFLAPYPLRAVLTDADSPDSLRIGVEVELNVALDTAAAIITIDATLTNRSDTMLRDCAMGWFYDWDLGAQPAKNSTWSDASGCWVASTEAQSPIVALTVHSSTSDAVPILNSLDNTTTYNGFSQERKRQLLISSTPITYAGVNDIAAVVGMRFTEAIPPGHRRMFRHVIAMDTSVAGVSGLLNNAWDKPDPSDSVFAGAPFPVPATDYVYIPSGGITASPASFAVYDAQGRRVDEVTFETVAGGQILVVLNVSRLPAGVYYVYTMSHLSLPDGFSTRAWPIVITR